MSQTASRPVSPLVECSIYIVNKEKNKLDYKNNVLTSLKQKEWNKCLFWMFLFNITLNLSRTLIWVNIVISVPFVAKADYVEWV